MTGRLVGRHLNGRVRTCKDKKKIKGENHMFWIGFVAISIALYVWWAYTLYEDMLDEK